MKSFLFLLPLLGLMPAAALAAGRELEGERAAAQTECPSPEEARLKMTVPPGYEVRNFAHEPMVQNPVAMTWDHRGRLWVVELYEYPEGTALPVEKRPFGGVAKDSNYRPVPEVCKAKDNPTLLVPREEAKIPRDRVLILEDTDNDGVADKRTVFLQGLDMGSAILCGDGGIYVGQQPHMLHFKDTDGDDHADEWRVVLTGFGREDTHELLNSFCWGPDGWLYMTHGVFTNSKVRRPGEPEDKGFKFDAGIGRCKPLTGEFEVFADGTSNPWGCDYDALGNFFVSACVIDHFFHMAPGGIYMRQGGAPENPYAYELLPSIVKHKHFRAAYAGVQIYQGGRYPEDTWGHAFIGNIHDNAIHEEVLTPVGATFKCEPRRDFLRANDGWFRPVSTQTGPDGFLWVMDWCDKYPCYQNAKANPEGVDRARGRIWRIVVPASAGKGGPPEGGTTMPSRDSRDMDLKKLPTPELVKLLEHSNNWMRRMARRILVERRDVRTTVAEIARIPDDAAPSAKIECLFTVFGLHATDATLLDKVSRNADPAMRAWSARLTGETWREALMSAEMPGSAKALDELRAGGDVFGSARFRLSRLSRDLDMSVRHATAVALRQFVAGNLTVNRPTVLSRDRRNGHPIVEGILGGIAAEEWIVGGIPSNVDPYDPADWPKGKLVAREKADSLVAFAGWQAVEPIVLESGGGVLLQTLIQQHRVGLVGDVVAERACRRAAESRDTKLLGQIAEAVSVASGSDARLARCLAGLVKGQEARVVKPDGDVAPILAKWLGTEHVAARQSAEQLAIMWGDPKGEEILRHMVMDRGLPDSRRIEALRLARRSSPGLLKDALSLILMESSSESKAVVLEAIRALADLPGDGAPTWVVEHWKTLAAPERGAAADVLASREAWAHKFMDAVTEKKIAAADVPMTVVRALSTHRNAGVKRQASEVFGAWRDSSDDIKALIAAKRKACLEGEPDLAAGKMLFATTCATCHTFHGGGQKVGPELIGSGRSNLDAILANVIDPNQIIGNGYEAINVFTKDNRTVSGRIVEDTPSHVKLLAIGGAEQIVPRDQIAKLENTHQSLMPMGFGALPDDAFRSLIWYVLAPPEEGPLTKEKKAALSASMDAAPAKRPSGNNSRAIDWESVSLWNPGWKVEAPDFERTPMRLADFHGRRNVLLMHPFTKDKPSSLERTAKLELGKPHQLSVTVAAHDQGDWELRVLVDGKVVKKESIGHDGERWKTVTVDLSEHAGKEVALRLEGAATDWAWEFGYWGEVKLE